jgi:hypothetical protein
MTPDEAAAVALALASLGLTAADTLGPRGTIDRESRQRRAEAIWRRIDEPRTWSDFARREALMIDGPVR